MSKQFVRSQSELYGFSVRGFCRHMALDVLSWRGLLPGAFKKNFDKPRVQIVEMHYLFDDEVEKFRMLLTKLCMSGHTLISYSEAVSRISSGNIERPYIAFTFDDGYKNCLTAAQVLEEFGVTGCFFLNSSIVGENRYSVIEKHCAEKIYKPPVDFMDWADVESLLVKGHEIGGHTYSHANLGKVEGEKIAEEVNRDKEILERYCESVDHFAWPYGASVHFSKEAGEVVFEAGYSSCASAIRGVHLPASSSHCYVRRNHIIAAWPVPHSLYLLAKSVNYWGEVDIVV